MNISRSPDGRHHGEAPGKRSSRQRIRAIRRDSGWGSGNDEHGRRHTRPRFLRCRGEHARTHPDLIVPRTLDSHTARIHAAVQQLVMEHGKYVPLELLLAMNRRAYEDCHARTECRLETLDTVLADGQRESCAWLEAAHSVWPSSRRCIMVIGCSPRRHPWGPSSRPSQRLPARAHRVPGCRRRGCTCRPSPSSCALAGRGARVCGPRPRPP